jgi:hypothetical protein
MKTVALFIEIVSNFGLWNLIMIWCLVNAKHKVTRGHSRFSCMTFFDSPWTSSYSPSLFLFLLFLLLLPLSPCTDPCLSWLGLDTYILPTGCQCWGSVFCRYGSPATPPPPAPIQSLFSILFRPLPRKQKHNVTRDATNPTENYLPIISRMYAERAQFSLE